MVEFLARYFLAEHYRVGLICSGYGRSCPISFVAPGYRVQKIPVSETGDEVQLLATLLPQAVFSVDNSKTRAARNLVASTEVDLAILDDGFQHRDLKRDVDIITYDAAVKRKMIKPFPYGILRESLSALKRADILVITRSNFARDRTRLEKKLRRINPDVPLYQAQFLIDELIGRNRRLPVKYLEDKAVFLFAGVGNFESLRKQVAVLSGHLEYTMELSDHQRYDRKLLKKIKSLVVKSRSDVIVTTGKDWVKLGDFDFGFEIYYLSQSIDLDPGEEKLIACLQDMLGLERRRQ